MTITTRRIAKKADALRVGDTIRDGRYKHVVLGAQIIQTHDGAEMVMIRPAVGARFCVRPDHTYWVEAAS